MIRSLVLAGSVGIGLGCDAFVADSPMSWYDAEVVAQLAPDCLEAGHDAVVCGCTLHHMANATREQGYFLVPLALHTGQEWPGDAAGELARWHASCETGAAAFGLQLPQVAAGPPG